MGMAFRATVRDRLRELPLPNAPVNLVGEYTIRKIHGESGRPGPQPWRRW